MSNLHPTPSLPDTGPTHNPHSVDDYVFRNTKQGGEGEGVRGCVGRIFIRLICDYSI